VIDGMRQMMLRDGAALAGGDVMPLRVRQTSEVF
jgi:hypothetical protein